MKNFYIQRRSFVSACAGLSLIPFSHSATLAELLSLTPKATEGPFYPDKLPLDTDNDLLILNNSLTEAVGEVSHLSGRVLTQNGSPLANATVEIWQVDSQGIYLHSKEPKVKNIDTNFQSYGRFLTNNNGEYYFRTIKPVKYKTGIFRTPHIHFKVSRKGKHILTTQMYIKGEALNLKDRIYNSIKDPKAKENVTREFKPFETAGLKQLQVNFDIIVGLTHSE